MPLETFQYLDSLNAANPPVSDGLAQGDDHIRGIKLALKQTFPNVTGAVTGTQGALNVAAGWTTAGTNLLAHGGTFFDNGAGAASTDGFLNTLAGDIDVQLQGVLAATFQRTGGVNFFKVLGNQTVSGTLAVTGTISGPGITPIGGTIIWWDDTLPSDGLWAWANGQIISNANVVAPVLLARWGSRFGGNGITTMGLPDLQDVVPVGKDTMGGAAGNGLLSSISSGVKGVLNSIFGSDTFTLITANLPPYTPIGSVTSTYGVGGDTTGLSGFITAVGTPGNVGLGGSAQGGSARDIRSNMPITSTFAGQAQGGTSQPISRLQPSKVVNWIIRIG